jgi:hypothetical protein
MPKKIKEIYMVYKKITKIIQLVLILILSLVFYACDLSIVSTLAFEDAKVILDDWAPSEISHNTELPFVEGVTLEFFLNNSKITSFKDVERPLFDKDMMLDVKVFASDQTKMISYEMKLLSDYSPRHNYSLHFESFDMSQLSREVPQTNQVTYKQNQDIMDTKDVMIRGRGNSSFFTHEKKSMKISFEKNVSWMGLRGDSFNLISMHSDKSLMRDALAHIVSKMIGLEITQETRYVEVYENMNFLGLFLLVEDRTYIKVDPFIDALQFAVEVDERINWDGRKVPYILIGNITHSIKRPFDYTSQESKRIETYLVNTLELIKKNVVPDYVDVLNWMQFLFIHELFKNVDAWGLSLFMYQSSDEILKFGPVWDFDLSLSNANYVNEGYLSPEGFYLLNHRSAIWTKDTMKITTFNRVFAEVVKSFYSNHFPTFLTIIDQLAEALIPYANKNFERWDILNTYTWPNPTFLYNISYRQQTEFVRHFILLRTEWMQKQVDTSEFMNKQY